MEKMRARMKNKNFIVMATVATLSSLSAHSAEPSFETISRCFFVYAPIFQVGRDVPHTELFQFGQVRVGYMGGYVQANKSNSHFKQVFEGNLSENKRAGIQLESSLKSAISSRNQSLFSSVINEAVACDRQIGIRTDFLPKL
jgi:hypothetical protein